MSSSAALVRLTPEAQTARQIALAAVEAERARVEGLLLEAFKHALSVSDHSPSKAARAMRITAKTVRRWLDGEHAIDVEAVLFAHRLGPHFVRHLASAYGLLGGAT